MKQRTEKLSLIGAIAAGLGASICCVLPLVLVMAGLGGAWLSIFSAFEPFRPLFIGVTVVFLAWAGYRLYWHVPACDGDETCTVSAPLRRQRLIFWVITGVIALLIAFPWYATWIL